MKNEVFGKVVRVLPAQTGIGARGAWRRQTVVIEYEAGRYTNKLALECSNNRAEEFGRLQVGQWVNFSYDVTSREYNDKYYTTANVFDWKVQGETQQQTLQAPPVGGRPF